MEPPNYRSPLSVEEQFTVYAVFMGCFDKVCHPYSYYYPSSTGGADSGDGGVDDSSTGALATFSLFSLALLFA